MTNNDVYVQIGGQPQQEDSIADFSLGRIHIRWAQWFTLWVGFHWYVMDGVTRGKNALIAVEDLLPHLS